MHRLVIATVLALGVLCIWSSGVRGAGTNAAEEAAIRKAIAAADQGPAARMTDSVFWSGAYRKPAISGKETLEAKSGPTAIGDRIAASQKSRTEPIRIIVAESRDLAYEYSRQWLEFDMKSGAHITAENGVLRVWQKQGGEWKEAAYFSHPYE